MLCSNDDYIVVHDSPSRFKPPTEKTVPNQIQGIKYYGTTSFE